MIDRIVLALLATVTVQVLAQPAGYQTVYSRTFDTNLSAGAYLKTDAWYFYWGGAGASTWSHPELDKRFQIRADPAQGDRSLYMVKFDGDRDYANQGLNPRTELSYRPSVERSASKEIYFRLRTWFPTSQAGVFAAEFIQFWLHGPTNIPLQIEVRNGVFNARGPWGYTALGGGLKLQDHLGRWLTWEVRAKFNAQGGYWRIHLDGDLVYDHTKSMSGWPSDAGTWHPQHGIYSNNGGKGTMECHFDDLLVAERSPASGISGRSRSHEDADPIHLVGRILHIADHQEGRVPRFFDLEGRPLAPATAMGSAYRLSDQIRGPFLVRWGDRSENARMFMAP